MHRRSFFATLFAAFLPKPQIQPVQFHWASNRISEYWVYSAALHTYNPVQVNITKAELLAKYPSAKKVGDTIIVRRPQRFAARNSIL